MTVARWAAVGAVLACCPWAAAADDAAGWRTVVRVRPGQPAKSAPAKPVPRVVRAAHAEDAEPAALPIPVALPRPAADAPDGDVEPVAAQAEGDAGKLSPLPRFAPPKSKTLPPVEPPAPAVPKPMVEAAPAEPEPAPMPQRQQADPARFVRRQAAVADEPRVQAPAAAPPVEAPVTLPVPVGMTPGGLNLPSPEIADERRNAIDEPKLPGVPKPDAATQAEFDRFVGRLVDPQNTLDLVIGRTRILALKAAAKRVQIEDETIATKPLVLAPDTLSISGRRIGSTVLTLYFADEKDPKKEHVLSYLVRVHPDPETRARLQQAYRELADQINRAFPDSVVDIKLVGDQVVLTGQAKDAADATQILRIVSANASNIPAVGPLAVVQAQAAAAASGRANPGGGGNAAVDPLPPGGVGPAGANANNNGQVANVVNLLRIPGEQQVTLHVTVAEVNRAAARSIGINFLGTNNAGNPVFAQNTGGLLNGIAGNGAGGGGAGLFNSVTGVGNALAAIDNGQLQIAINALRTVNLARSLAEPNLTTLNGRPAQFQAGGRFPVPVVTGATNVGLQGVEFVPFGVSLQFTPTITDRDRIRLDVQAEVSARDLGAGQTAINGAGVPSLSTRNFSNTVELRDGETLAVAGLIQNNFSSDGRRVPLLGDLPGLGRFFANDSTSCGDQELVVLITPRLVRPTRCPTGELPGADLVSPTDLEFFLGGKLQSRGRGCTSGPCDDGMLLRRVECSPVFGGGLSTVQP